MPGEVERASELLARGDRAGARAAALAAARRAEDRGPIAALLEAHFPLPPGARERLELLASEETPLDARAKALARAPSGDPRFAGPALSLLEALVRRERSLAAIPSGALEALVGPGDVARLRALLLARRRRSDDSRDGPKRRVSDSLYLRGLLDRASGGAEPAPSTLASEVACPGCGWPALLACGCGHLTCGFATCATAAPPAPDPTRVVCTHESLSAIRNDRNLDLPSPPRRAPEPEDDDGDVAIEALDLGPEWRRVGEVSADAGRVGALPLGGGRGVACETGVGDGTFPVEARSGAGADHVELRVLFRPAARGGRWSAAGAAGSRSGFFVLGDPIVRAERVSERRAAAACARARVASVSGCVVVRAAAVAGSARWRDDRPAELLLRFSPTIRQG